MNNIGTVLKKTENRMEGTFSSNGLPARKGSRPRTSIGPLHIQSDQHGDRKYLQQLVDDGLTWPHVESPPPLFRHPETLPVRLQEGTTSSDSSAFLSDREFARVLLGASTIYLALPLVCAHWAIVRGWAEPHYLRSFGLMPAGAVLVYAPTNRKELEVCYSLFFEAYYCAYKFAKRDELSIEENGRRAQRYPTGMELTCSSREVL